MSERDKLQEETQGTAKALEKKNECLMEVKSKLACMESLIEEKDFMLNRVSSQVQELHR